jgi:hypothetical protein
MTPRAALLAVTSATGLLLARALDGLGLLPGVAESEAVRRAALDPRVTALGLLGCLALGLLAERLLAKRPAAAGAVLVVGQLGLVVGLEEGGRELSGAPEGGGETGLWVAAAVQLVLAVVAVTTALVVLAFPVSPFEPTLSGWVARRAGLPPYRLVARLIGGGERDRAPPGAA